MLLKRHYKIPDGWEPKRNVYNEHGKLADASRAFGDILNPPPVDHVEIRHTGAKAEQNFSEKLVRAGLNEGWVSLSRGKLILHADPEDLVYDILRTPGYYCCHCGEEIPDAGAFIPNREGFTRGMEHVQVKHEGEKSPDPSNPSGYRRINHYEVKLDSGQHKKYGFKEKAAPRKKGDGRG